MRRCFVAVRVAMLVAGLNVPGPAQDATDWPKEVERACTSPRYGLRLAAARKVAGGGAGAVAAVRAFERERGPAAIPVALVEAFADLGGNDEAVLALLEGWARDRDFFWRAQALRGLALRADDAAIARRYWALFGEYKDDPAWLTRVFARYGLVRAIAHVADARTGLPSLDPDPDPRARTKLMALLGQPEPLVMVLGDQRTFLGDPWGRRMAAEAFAALKQWAGDDFGYRVDASFAANRTAIERFARLLAERSGGEPTPVHPFEDPPLEFTGGFEVLSCRHGDLFVRWTGDGGIHSGLEDELAARLPAATWRELAAQLAALPLEAQHGVVICDRMRLVPSVQGPQAAVAPGALPAAATDWLKRLALALEEAGGRELAAALRDRLQQFVAH